MTLTETVKTVTEAVVPGKVQTSVLQKVVSVIDLTSLDAADTDQSIAALCAKATLPIGHVAAVCVYPRFVQFAAEQFVGTPLHIATVANFPAGSMPIEVVVNDIKKSISLGANEIDVVFPYVRYFSGDKQYARSLVEAARAACGPNVIFKVILETGAFSDLATLAAAGEDAVKAGADFLKTGTGKIKVGATLEAAATLLLLIQKIQPIIKRPIGLKVSGGVRTITEAVQYMDLAAKIMGQEWVNKKTFRIGASSLLDEVISSLG
jgi:deoxyribose-phosphate aldolase